MNNNQELAIKFGVPTFETCEKLDWKEETLFTWYSVEGKHYLILTEEFKNSKLYEDISYPAPQMHEILNSIPHSIKYQPKGKRLGYYYLTFRSSSVLYKDIISGDDGVYANYYDRHYAEGYAKIYLKLKENQLLK